MEGEISSYRVLKTQREYIKLIAANLINRFGDSIDAIAFSLMMYEITESASLMALILGLNYLPTIFLQPLTGAYVERLSKKHVMIAFDLARGALVALAVWLYELGRLNPPLLIAMTLSISTMEAFRTPAGVAIVPMLIKEEHYTVAVALNQTLSRAMELLGLAVAGGVVMLVGYSRALLIDTGTFFLSALVIGFIRVREPPHPNPADVRSVFSDFTEGVRLMRKHAVLPALLFLAALINFSSVPLNAFSVAYVSDWLRGDAAVLSATQFLLVGGTLVGSAVSPKIKRVSRRAQVVAFGLLGAGSLLMLGLGARIESLDLRRAVALLGCFLQGLSAGVNNVVFSASLMRNVPKAYIARLSGLANAIMACSIPLGSFVCSALAAFVAVPTALIAAATLSLALYLGILSIASLRKL